MRPSRILVLALLLAPAAAKAADDGTCSAYRHCGFLCSLGHDVSHAAGWIDSQADKLAPSRWDIPIVDDFGRPEPATRPIPAACGPAGVSVRVMSYNTKSLQLSSADAVAKVIRDAAPDVLALQETDDRTWRSGLKNQTKELAMRTGLDHYVHLSAQHFWIGGQGVSLLSRFQIIESRTWLLPWKSTTRAFVCAKIATPGGATTYCSVHLDLDDAARREEIARIESIIARFDDTDRVVLMGDFNSDPLGLPLRLLKRDGFHDSWNDADGPGFTFPSWAPTDKIDFILTRGAVTADCDRVPDAQASDHRPLVGVVHGISGSRDPDSRRPRGARAAAATTRR